MKKIKTYYRRRLPHIQPIGATFFVTFRLFNSIPYAYLIPIKRAYSALKEKILSDNIPDKKDRLEKAKQRYFTQYDALLDSIKTGPVHLKHPDVAQQLQATLHRFDGKFYELIAYAIMSNHVHLLINTAVQLPEYFDGYNDKHIDFVPLDKIMKRVKGPTAIYANRILNRTGQFWERESFDQYIRGTSHLHRVIHYILMNPVKAKLVEEWEEWKFSYFKP